MAIQYSGLNPSGRTYKADTRGQAYGKIAGSLESALKGFSGTPTTVDPDASNEVVDGRAVPNTLGGAVEGAMLRFKGWLASFFGDEIHLPGESVDTTDTAPRGKQAGGVPIPTEKPGVVK